MAGRALNRRPAKEGTAIGDERKTYYVAVGAGQVLEDKEAAPFEFAIRANDEELNKLQEKFEELSSVDEASMVHFTNSHIHANLERANEDYESQLKNIYAYLYELGTDETKRHIEANHILD
ncbi:hypothetical protein COLU111180_05980 [Cohnella lubricantis]|uniref:Hydrolase n=1 Tax=Cohnella lubricantis TaxID=2163172 RepID=A0A841T8D4_9BACL|nr:hypothetical protein [Cohnella lubricantis]MBB6677574.1 hypothetical protein [Cohnella lubricantis]MBP2116540.1 hypothetical protein [Cohnella lubricantis]